MVPLMNAQIQYRQSLGGSSVTKDRAYLFLSTHIFDNPVNLYFSPESKMHFHKSTERQIYFPGLISLSNISFPLNPAKMSQLVKN